MLTLRRGAQLLPAIALLSALLWTATPTTADAAGSAPIEGVWAFNGGRIVIQPAEGGDFEGTVVAPTTFSVCPHPVGERIWTQMAPQPDGSYWGLHQWFFESSECTPNPTLGQTAWRVFQKKSGRYLRVCFSEPGSGLQPTIAADGSYTNATFGCVDSALIGAAPAGASLGRSIQTPPTDGCLARRALRVRISDPRNDPIAKIAVTYRAGSVTRKAKVKRHAHGAVATVPLRGITAARVRVKVQLTTVLGHRWHGSRRYRICAKAGGHRLPISSKSGTRSRPGGGR